MGIATLTSTAVVVDTASDTGLYRLDPPIVGDDGKAHEYGAAIVTPFGILVDVWAAHEDGSLVLDDDGDWVALINSTAAPGARPTVAGEFESAGYRVHSQERAAS
ncbi:hypothetical protein AB4Z09_09340 [Rhodococcus sp. TAF43]|uniref:hypothetical protein n=1 Tax=unclassified Rhodococcus (in: high G+C Gram-positive bacteria) TaxID=192944 RepID=UPI000E0B66A4|nr:MULTISPECIES: hypothetical protein [unclassified Rhodococcus (in: high G+C Gram-positive bacteria)]QKT11679.1 hypothetical protein HUN07_13900 [Rhodococcus sp. W8901]RDI23251.1 hypothetical protein DEU38_112115 [Rhodococcus sp. AG1013]